MSDKKTFQEVFAEIFDESWNVMIDRQSKYGNANIQQLGLYGVLSRVANDKMSRVMKSLNGTIVDGKVHLDAIEDKHRDEAFEDALFDIANYALIAIAVKRGCWGGPLEEKTKWQMQSPDTKSSTSASTAKSGLRSFGTKGKRELRAAQTEKTLTGSSKLAAKS
jgi:hypothetical protein